MHGATRNYRYVWDVSSPPRTSRRRLRVRDQRPATPSPRKKESTTQKARAGDLRRSSTLQATQRSRAAERHPTTSRRAASITNQIEGQMNSPTSSKTKILVEESKPTPDSMSTRRITSKSSESQEGRGMPDLANSRSESR